MSGDALRFMRFEEIKPRAEAQQTFECLARREDRGLICDMVGDYEMQVWESRLGNSSLYEITVAPWELAGEGDD